MTTQRRRAVSSPRFLLAALGLVLGLGAGGGADGREASGTLQICLPEAVASIDPPRAGTEAARTLTANLFERLFDYHYLRRPFALEPSLAAAMPTVSDDGLVWTLRLRRDVRYADDPCFEGGTGRAISARDVVFCLKRLVDARVDSSARWVFHDRIVGLRAFAEATVGREEDPRGASYDPSRGYPEVPGLEVVDEGTLRITLTRRFPDLPYLLASTYASIYPPELLRHYGTAMGLHPVGTGPYRVASFLPGRSLILARNPAYRERHYPETGASRDAGARLPLNERVVVTFESGGVPAWNVFLHGRSDISEIPPHLAPDTVDLALRKMRPELGTRGVSLEATPRLEVYFLAFNMGDPVIGHPAGEKGLALRRAICLVDDVEWDVHRLYRDTAIAVEGPLLDEFPESDPSFKARWIKEPDESMEDVMTAAREVLAEVGFADGEGVPPLEMEVVDDPGSRQSFGRFQRNLADIGVTVRPVYGDWATMRKRIDGGKARMWRSSWAADYPSAQTFFEVFFAPSNPDPIAGGYRNPEFDEIFELALEAGPGEERTGLYRDLQKMLCEDCPWRFRYRRLRLDATHDWLSNYRYNDLVPRWFEYCRVEVGKRTAYRR